MPDSRDDSLLKLSLAAAVPLWIEWLRDVPLEERRARALVCGQVIAEKGDIIMFKGGKRGETAEAFNRLAEGLACLAFAPGGVRFLTLHFTA